MFTEEGSDVVDRIHQPMFELVEQLGQPHFGFVVRLLKAALLVRWRSFLS